MPNHPLIRFDGQLRPCEQFEVLGNEETEAAVRHRLGDETKLAEWAREGEVDFSYAIGGLARFR